MIKIAHKLNCLIVMGEGFKITTLHKVFLRIIADLPSLAYLVALSLRPNTHAKRIVLKKLVAAHHWLASDKVCHHASSLYL